MTHKKLTSSLSLACGLLLTWVCQAGEGALFNVKATGVPKAVDITLCLNGTASLSCQNFHVSALNLTISTTIPNRLYPAAGIKINTPGHTVIGCTPNSNGYCLFSVSNTASKTIALFPPVGSAYGGGVIACLGGAPYMNLIAATSDSINGIPWGGFATTTEAQSAVDGKSNSTLIINAGVTNSAVNECSGNINGYTDWFLPAKDQLNCLYANQKAISGFMNAAYWSSTESDEDHAWFQFFDNGNQLDVFKTFYYSVRCVRTI